MSSQFFSSLLLWIAITAGMVAQDVVGKLSAAMEKKAAVAQETPAWATAESFYQSYQVALETPDDDQQGAAPEAASLPETAAEPAAATESTAASLPTADETPRSGAEHPVPVPTGESIAVATPVVEEPAPVAVADGSPPEPTAGAEMVGSSPATDVPAGTIAAQPTEEAAQPVPAPTVGAEVPAATPPAPPVVAAEVPAATPPAPARTDILPAPADGPATPPADAPHRDATDSAPKRLTGTAPNDPAPRLPLARPPTAADYPAPSLDASPSSPPETDAQRLIRERAAMKAAERTRRIEIWKWYRYSPLRPPAQPLPMMGGADTTVPSLR